ncbi:MAG: outer membrane protein assembly factor BamB [Gammaproteobacteria bacterium]|nr:outer membrane protein assembly factor BamB [Gammaproteobacteria bacterium]
MKRFAAIAILPAALLSLGACGIFGGDDDEELQPAELLDFEATLPVRKAWSAKVGKGSEFLRLALRPAGDGNRVYAASFDGNVVAFDAASGKRVWTVELDLNLSSGPGVGEDLVVVGGQDGDVIALRSEDGSEVWRVNIAGESLATPLIKDDSVAVLTIDGRLRALSRFDGSEKWVLEQSYPALTLRGSASPILVGTTLIAGFDNGRVVASRLADGTTEWEALLSPPSGRSDLERLSDVDGYMTAIGQDVYASGYHGRVAAVAAESGQALWAREISAHTGVGADWNNVYVVDEQGELIALSRRNGSDVWRQSALLRREPTTPVAFNTAVAVGDFEGYLHFFDNSDGRPVARVRVGKGMLSGPPVVVGGQLVVQSESGDIATFVVPQPESPGNAPDISSGST